MTKGGNELVPNGLYSSRTGPPSPLTVGSSPAAAGPASTGATSSANAQALIKTPRRVIGGLTFVFGASACAGPKRPRSPPRALLRILWRTVLGAPAPAPPH